ncbi:PEP/pyruvate-binding domain-containing protein [Nocardiopsis sp. NRRL B-16309]|uniref:PEP/pyruvate-binding domain-containing protein n=1 Tax=Nocardiopsis sp. NRRL B-16309 TaxID=1519494 RepID=UPI0006B03DE8|nr:PEP/pyruvate-binding domain-containing protein [Nocardiopsis sp. NRRL B-16309]
MIDFAHIDAANVAEVGGKGAALGELARIDGVRVPNGFCVTTDAFRRMVGAVPPIGALLDRLARVAAEDRAAIRALSAEVRRAVEDVAVHDALAAQVGEALTRLGADGACAVRSSATAEDLPTASFAGQQDSYLNVTGPDAVLRHVRLCWASLFTERAVTYRVRNGFDHRGIGMAVVVQRMVFPDAAGTMFTADPVTSNRGTVTVEAGWGLGEALVSGRVCGDVYTVRDGRVVSTAIADKTLVALASPGGGVQEAPVEPELRTRPALTAAQAVRLARLGRSVEAHFGRPQDIEWCRVGDDFHVVQSRPITTLFPIPPSEDGENHVYVSVGHQQMMTDAMKPLGLSFWQMTTPRRMHEAGGRLFVDVAPLLATSAGRAGLMEALGGSDPLLGDAMRTVLDRDGFVRTDDDAPGTPDASTSPPTGTAPAGEPPAGTAPAAPPAPVDADPALVHELIRAGEASVATLRSRIRDLSGPPTPTPAGPRCSSPSPAW